MALYKFYWDCGRQGEIEGVFECDDSSLIVGKDVDFGEVLGKHSHISGTIEEDDIEFLTDDEDFITKAKEYGLVPCGYDPLDYIVEV